MSEVDMKTAPAGLGGFAGLHVVCKEGMLRNGWFAKDAAGEIIGSGALGLQGGLGEYWTGDRENVRALEVGSDVYAALSERTEAVR